MGFETTFGELPPLYSEKPLRTEAVLSRRGDDDAEVCVCGAEVKEQPKITEKGTCSVCGAKLAIKK